MRILAPSAFLQHLFQGTHSDQLPKKNLYRLCEPPAGLHLGITAARQVQSRTIGYKFVSLLKNYYRDPGSNICHFSVLLFLFSLF